MVAAGHFEKVFSVITLVSVYVPPSKISTQKQKLVTSDNTSQMSSPPAKMNVGIVRPSENFFYLKDIIFAGGDGQSQTIARQKNCLKLRRLAIFADLIKKRVHRSKKRGLAQGKRMPRLTAFCVILRFFVVFCGNLISYTGEG